MFSIYGLPIIILCVSGVIVTAILFIAAKYLAVPVDEKVEEVRAELPGANCGACGYSGCDGYAEAVASGEAACNLCIPAGADAAKKIADIVGSEAGDMVVAKAFVRCNGTCDNTKDKVDYTGEETCAACALLHGGKGNCQYGCLGFGDCEKRLVQAVRLVLPLVQRQLSKCKLKLTKLKLLVAQRLLPRLL